MQSKVTAKIEGGKLLRIELELTESGEKVKAIKLTGDFFIHPEDSLQIIEKALVSTSPAIETATLSTNLQQLTSDQGIQMLGITNEAIAKTFAEAVRQAKEGKEMPIAVKESERTP